MIDELSVLLELLENADEKIRDRLYRNTPLANNSLRVLETEEGIAGNFGPIYPVSTGGWVYEGKQYECIIDYIKELPDACFWAKKVCEFADLLWKRALLDEAERSITWFAWPTDTYKPREYGPGLTGDEVAHRHNLLMRSGWWGGSNSYHNIRVAPTEEPPHPLWRELYGSAYRIGIDPYKE